MPLGDAQAVAGIAGGTAFAGRFPCFAGLRGSL